ncbi:lectin [Ctenopharyngodon idella]|uniref:C-type lectin n=1 Tax=Ctenopharyngodon idella TaxID=7959 RepID=G1ELY6_CTEID|nr:lectin [Ctenopharyngodon idella]AEH76770.1 C-type lectin 2 [Ctenopharyngodon idella]AEH76776.1 C-type lectin 2 [Ctenopharyngodon idella]AEK20854.1 C-type lectin [Ctenopharyngodon idella]
MWKSGSISVLLLTLFLRGGNFLTMERGFAVDHTNVTKHCVMPKACGVHGFTDWFKVGHHCVKYFNTPDNFTEAEFKCRAKAPGAHLVSVHNNKDNGYLLCIVSKFNPGNLRLWLGGFEFFQSGKFFWIDGSFWDYQVWTRGEPNHIYTGKEECVEMNWKEVGRWNDDSCSSKKNYICAFKQHGMLEKDLE